MYNLNYVHILFSTGIRRVVHVHVALSSFVIIAYVEYPGRIFYTTQTIIVVDFLNVGHILSTKRAKFPDTQTYVQTVNKRT